MIDAPRFTVVTLLAAVDRKTDAHNLRVLRGAVLRSAFNHLFSAQLEYGVDERYDVGMAMCELLILAGDRT